MRDEPQILKEPGLYLVQVLAGILVGHVGGANVQLEIRPKIFKVVIVWQFCKYNRVVQC